MRASAARWLRPLAGVAILAVLAWRLGAEPFLDGIRHTNAAALLVAVLVTAATTWCCAARWSLLADRLDVAVPTAEAYLAVYRAQFLNATLPGGILGDVHRGIRHGRDSGALARALRSVLWDRTSGQVVQVALAVAAVPLLPVAAREWVLWPVGIAVAVVVLAGAATSRTRAGRAVVQEARHVVGAPDVRLRVAVLSALAVGGHLVAFVVAARSAGIDAPVHELVPLGLVVLLASAVPLSVAGWGPREGAAVAVFAASGLGAGAGLTVSVVYGVMVLVATLPGALLFGRRAAVVPGAGGTPAREEGGPTWASARTRS